MGVTFWTTCKTCKKDAPELGDYGYIGFPSLDPARRRSRDGLQSFGYILEGFEAIGLVPLALEEFREFLKAHDGHVIKTSGGDEDDEDGDDDEDDANDEDADRAGDDDHDDDDGGRDEDDEDGDGDEALPAGWVNGYFELRCRTCKKKRRTKSVESLRERSELRLSPEAVERFGERVIVCLDGDNFYHSEPFGEDDLQGIGGFLDKHKGHDVASRVVPMAGEE